MFYFNEEVARIVSTDAAVIFQNIIWWIEKNKANKKNFFDDEYWTYNSASAFELLFPWMNKRKIERVLVELRESGLIKTGSYNTNKYDRTTWYALTELGKSFSRICRIDAPDLSHGRTESVAPIPDSNTVEKTNNKVASAEADEVIGYLNKKANRVYRSDTHKPLIVALIKKGYTVNDMKTVIDKKCLEWIGTDYETYLRPSTLFNPKHFDEYLTSPCRLQKEEKVPLKEEKEGYYGGYKII